MIDPPRIAIIGGGAAGIGAARALSAASATWTLLEASDRLGGRAHTLDVVGVGALDLGCGWLHSARRNAWVGVAEQLGFAVDRSPSAWGTQYRDLGFPPAEQRAAGEAFESFSARLREEPPASDCAADALAPGCPWNPWLEALSGYINGAALDRLSIRDYLAYDDAAGEENWRLPAGYGALVAAAAPTGHVALACPVTGIDRRGRALRLETTRGVVEADSAIVTVSTAVLAAGAIRFDPALDDRLHAAARLPLGLADKLFLSVDVPDDLPVDGHLLGDPRRAETGSYYLRPFGRPVVECFFGAGGARALEHAGLDGAAAFAREELAALLGSAFGRRLRLIAGSAWGRARWTMGSYSHALPGHADARATLAAPVDGRLFFSGEATHPTDFSTAHGALETGERAAREALAALGLPG